MKSLPHRRCCVCISLIAAALGASCANKPPAEVDASVRTPPAETPNIIRCFEGESVVSGPNMPEETERSLTRFTLSAGSIVIEETTSTSPYSREVFRDGPQGKPWTSISSLTLSRFHLDEADGVFDVSIAGRWEEDQTSVSGVLRIDQDAATAEWKGNLSPIRVPLRKAGGPKRIDDAPPVSKPIYQHVRVMDTLRRVPDERCDDAFPPVDGDSPEKR